VQAPPGAEEESDGEIRGADGSVQRDVVLRALRREWDEERQQQEDQEPAKSVGDDGGTGQPADVGPP
jgi:hypothetical protein